METFKRKDLKELLKNVLEEVSREKEFLTKLDSDMGDGDLGITMTRGFEALYNEFDSIETEDMGILLMRLGMILNTNVPSTMGTLLSICLTRGAIVVKGKEKLNLEDIVKVGKAAVMGVMEKGKTEVGNKTMLDALHPAVDALQWSLDENLSIKEAFEKAYDAAKKGAEGTKGLISKHGRAAYYGEKSLGKLDAGSVAVMLIFKGIAKN